MAHANAKAASAEQTDDAQKLDLKILAGYSGASGKVAALITALTALGVDLRAQETEVGEVTEARRREQDKATYDMAAERQVIVDRHKAEDAARAADHKARETALRDAEDDLLRELNVKRDTEGKVPTVRIIAAALAAKIQAATDTARNEGIGIAKKDAAAEKKLADAEAAADKKIKEAELVAARARIAELEKANEALLASQQTQMSGYAAVATKALDAAAGITGKANETLSSAVTQNGTGPGRRPGLGG